MFQKFGNLQCTIYRSIKSFLNIFDPRRIFFKIVRDYRGGKSRRTLKGNFFIVTNAKLGIELKNDRKSYVENLGDQGFAEDIFREKRV